MDTPEQSDIENGSRDTDKPIEGEVVDNPLKDKPPVEVSVSDDVNTGEETLTERMDKAFSSNRVEIVTRDFSAREKGDITNILSQRQKQRKWLFWYAITFSSLCFIGLVIMLVAQGIYIDHHQQPLFGKLELGTVGIGVFLQFLGLLKIITDSLWDDKPYLDAGALKENNKGKLL